jgi:hypothetical protein
LTAPLLAQNGSIFDRNERGIPTTFWQAYIGGLEFFTAGIDEGRWAGPDGYVLSIIPTASLAHIGN